MIKKCTVINYVDGTNYEVKTVVGPFERESQAKNVAKAWLGPDSSESSFENESPVQPITKKRKETAKCSRKLENDFLKLPVPPTLPLSARGTTAGESPLMSSDVIPGSSFISENSTPIDNLKKATISSSEVELLLSDTIIEPNPNSENISPLHDITIKSEDGLKTSTAEDNVSNLLANSLMLLDDSTGFQDINYRDNNAQYDNFDSTLINNEETNSTNTADSGLMDLSNFISKKCNSNVKIVNAMKNMDQKLQVIMKADSRMRSLALPIPVLPTELITLLAAKCIEEVDVVESILSDDIDGLNNQEELYET
ncbi:hypothetical protein AGLY_011519 [Aphis glycines]|uniref:Uncharacterized protein n=1 Tax=Aphis glycines TaxID=307491 RepID=A0A6G0TC57_APHGL|nr:hypothetical protein AGLY_011519 [Aphis glycines]